ncbi:hypothetical protein D0817_00815 [Flavobacterium cupreum]|uniref:Uncharacterized protein n=1 Tax=Flavobacterium cupreum TaxID=2133766 RepID=A0A434ACU0_9FLAO|nr:hypothetical protein [Flavobacterium cupreum]RUT72192.1 hypothetical protein D0817_00815 [Flavobacterium cupreum]
MKSGTGYFKFGLRQYNCLCMLFFLGLCASCTPKVYQKSDYTFYDRTFRLDASTVLRTDGVYVLDHIWTKENGGTVRQPKEHRFYKFYSTGQCNLTLDPSNEIKTKANYLTAINKDFTSKNSTLFEGYYKLENHRIIIQAVVVPRRQFEYKYGYSEQDTLVLVQTTTQGNGKFDDRYFTGAYKEYYVFLPLEIKEENEPQW